MKEYPKNQLDPKIKNVWRISSIVWVTIMFLCLFLCLFIPWLFEPLPILMYLWIAIIVAYVVSLIIFTGVLPQVRYMRWRYELSEDYLDIARGIVWKNRTIIPFIRVQNTDTRQGPILRAFRLSSVTVATAAGEHAIPGLSNEVAEEVRDRAAELARIAQEDV